MSSMELRNYLPLARALSDLIRNMLPSTLNTYRRFTKSRQLTPETVTLNDGNKAHWIGSSESDIIILFFHGGGYFVPALHAHFALLKQLLDDIHQKSQKEVAALVLQYDLAPQAKYPRPLEQAVALLEYATTSLAIDPSRSNAYLPHIVLAGDSAGGGIALGLALHLSHPHPSLPKLELKSPFMGLAVFSPWVTFSSQAPSWTRNGQKDLLSAEMCRKWSQDYMGMSPSDAFCEPLTAPKEWWKDLLISEILLIGGSDEVFIDDIKAMGSILDEVVLGKVTTIVVEGIVHGEPIVSMMLGNEGSSEQVNAFVSWFGKIGEI
ncbi:alpha/beta-hydrolase [Penicillium sp. IBT 16267x]|nr:alpha/beta-hydrolase [Penicillium sp. IBT 16267x]